MAEKQKKYSLITLDSDDAETGDEPVEAQIDGVRTARSIVDGEETIVVQSAPSDITQVDSSKPTEATDTADATGSTDADDATVVWSKPKPQSKADNSTEGEDEVPFKRMQAVIIFCLIALIVVFFVYFNFLR